MTRARRRGGGGARSRRRDPGGRRLRPRAGGPRARRRRVDCACSERERPRRENRGRGHADWTTARGRPRVDLVALARDADGEIVDRQLMTLTLTCDHRILYGADAARFLATIRDLLEQPLRLAL